MLKISDKNNWERGKFEFIEEMGNYELVEGVKCMDGKKTRAKWIYDCKENEMHGVKMVKRCAHPQCQRNSENSKKVFRLCGRCQNVFYCTRRHQRNDWQRHRCSC
ncbi:MAG: zinc finger MYND domain-containing protein, partial [Desulfobacterales bacterium]|nr:zinc finger MYND domain-containing protein [Desulfobacterales bacterium]